MKDLLVRLQRSVPVVRAWMLELHDQHAQAAVPVIRLGLARLASYWPSSLLERARAVYVDRVPFPPVSALGLPEFETIATMEMAGITFGDMYFLNREHAGEGTHCHELVHVAQWSALGDDDFLLTYALGFAQHGYQESPLEAIAFEAQAAYEQDARVPDLFETVLAHAKQARAAASALFESQGLRLGRLTSG